MSRPDSFTDFVTGQGRGLLRTAWLLTGDWASAEDLVQTTFTKAWRHWDRVGTPTTRRRMSGGSCSTAT
jgi:DNA-directed RNA polymerase specialized sigma24 family protein